MEDHDVCPAIYTRLDVLDSILLSYAAILGKDFQAYRNHACRVVNFSVAISGGAGFKIEKFEIAAAFHDLGIWEKQTFDYLHPSVDMAKSWLAKQGKLEWEDEIVAMILYHHKITKCNVPHACAESFRKADWLDVSFGFLNSGLSRDFIGEVFSVFPTQGFHHRLVQIAAKRFFKHPLNPLPMIRW